MFHRRRAHGDDSPKRKRPTLRLESRDALVEQSSRGAWESGGHFLERSPHEDILDIIDDFPKEIEEIAFGRGFRLSPDQIFVIGGSFGGAAAILASLDPQVKRVIANCPVVDWKILDRSEKVETSKESYAEYIRDAFGNGYRLSDANWAKLRSGTLWE